MPIEAPPFSEWAILRCKLMGGEHVPEDDDKWPTLHFRPRDEDHNITFALVGNTKGYIISQKGEVPVYLHGASEEIAFERALAQLQSHKEREKENQS